MFGQSLLSAFGIACTTDTDQLFGTDQSTTSAVTYELNGNANSIGGSFNGTEGSSLSYTTGKFGQAASFDATSNSYINWGTGNTAGINNNNITFSFWIKPHSTPNGSGNDFQRALITTQNTYYMYVSQSHTNKIKFSNDQQVSGDPVNGYVTESNSSVSLNVWTHVAVSMSSTGGTKIYINGVLDKTQSNRKNNAISMSGESFIGGYRSSSGSSPYEYFYDGEIDQIRTFNSVLPQSAITSLYNETTTTATSASIDYVDANPNSVAYYKMADATDQLGNYNGTATNVNFNTEGKFGFAGAFNGSSSSFSFSNSAYGSSTTVFTASGWFKHTSSANSREDIYFGNGATVGGLSGYAIYTDYSTGNIGLSFRTNPNQVFYNSSTNIKDGNWHHVCLTYNNGVYVLYVDNVSILNGTSSYYLNNLTPSKDTFVGSRYGTTGAGTSIIGAVDQIRIYDSALSAANVSTLYKEVECEPAAINALANFNTVIYTGNGSTQAISTVGFQPDLVWVKNRNTAGNPHELADSVRGVNNTINTNTASGQYNNTTYQFNSFDSNGFTVTDDSAGNYAVNGNNETYVAWNWKAPLANLSTSFNGSSSYIDTNTTFTPQLMSFSAWLNPSDASAYRTLFSNRNANTGNYNGIDFGITSSGNIYSRFSDGSNQGSTSSNTVPIPLNTWTHLAFTVDTSAGEAKVYKNGSLSYTVSIGTGSGIATGNDFYIGRYFTSSSSYIKGKVGQVRIFNDALTSSEVTELYNETASDNSVLNYPAGAGCIAAYPLQTDAVDLSGNYSGASSNVTFGQPGYLTGNTDGTIPSTVAANQEAGFSIVEYTGNATSGATIAHGLGVDADMVIVKSTNLSQAWNVYVKDITDTSAKYLRLNQNDAILTTASPRFIPNNFTSDVFSVGNDNSTNGNNDNYIAYCFTSIPGYSKIGSYIGNDTTNTIYVGFKPRFLLIKCSSNGGTNKEWVMIDSTMDPSTPITKRLEANTSDAEATDTINITMNNNGWTMPNGTSTASINQIGFSYIFLAIA